MPCDVTIGLQSGNDVMRPCGIGGSNDCFAATQLNRWVTAWGRKDQFATGGSSRWPDIADEWLALPQTLPPAKVRFEGEPDIRPGDRSRSGIGDRCHSPANPDRLQPV